MSKKQPPVCALPDLSAAEQAVADALREERQARADLQDVRAALARFAATHHVTLTKARAAMVAAGQDHVIYQRELVAVRGGSAGVEPSLQFLPAPRVLGGAA